MGGILQLTQGLLDSTNAFNSVWKKEVEKDAEFYTLIKQTQLQNDMNAELLKIGQSGDFQNWNNNISQFFTKVKNGMSDPESPYYCKNQIQADQFNKILADNHTRMSYQVAQMAQRYAINQMQADYEKGIANLKKNNVTGDDFEEQSNGLATALFNNGGATPLQLEDYKTENAKTGYRDLVNSMFTKSFEDALRQGKTFNEYWNMIEQEASKTNVSNSVTPEEKEKQKYELQTTWNAREKDIQKENADQLENISRKIKFSKSEQEIISLIGQGQNLLNSMKGNELSMNDKRHYADEFKSLIDYYNQPEPGENGSGSGSSKKEISFDKVVKAKFDNAVYLIQSGQTNGFDAKAIISKDLRDQWDRETYKEAVGLSAEEKDNTWKLLYSGVASEQSLTKQLVDMIIADYPEAKALFNSEFADLLNDIGKHPKDFDEASLQDLRDWMIDTVLGYKGTQEIDQFMNDLKKKLNGCYIGKCKTIELHLNDKITKEFELDGKTINQKFKANNPTDIAKAAQFIHNNDYVYTYKGQTRWAKGKKEALEAKGGIIDVFKNAVAGTLGITDENELGKIGFYYKPDEEHNDMTSIPLITYKDKAYEVLPTADGQNFQLQMYGVTYDKNGEPIEFREIGKPIDGYIPDYKALRKEKKKLDQDEQKAINQRNQLKEDERIDKVNRKIESAVEMPKAIKAVGISEKEWSETKNDFERRESLFRNAIDELNKDARKVDRSNMFTDPKKKMTEKEFTEKWGILYSTWIEQNGRNAQYSMILNSY